MPTLFTKILLAALALLTLNGCISTRFPSDGNPDKVRLNEVYQGGRTGDVWECKNSRCQKIR